jgi:hypothetical protein
MNAKLMLMTLISVKYLFKVKSGLCGQFVDRILSTSPLTNGKKWEWM